MKLVYCFLLLVAPMAAFSQDSAATKTSGQDSMAAKQPVPAPAPAPAPAPPKKPHHSLGLGIMAGLNFTNITGTSDISNSSETGFLVGVFLDPKSSSLLGSRTELVYSHQAYNFSTGTTTGTNYLNYLMLAQLMSINITHFFQIQIGTQMGYLLNAKSDSNKTSTGYAQADQILDYYNRFIFGFSGGLEVRPFMGIIVGARYNLSLTNLYKVPTYTPGSEPPSFIPTAGDINFKNNLIQVYVGYRF
jgi:Outer membrane protein beta-barrel domain